MTARVKFWAASMGVVCLIGAAVEMWHAHSNADWDRTIKEADHPVDPNTIRKIQGGDTPARQIRAKLLNGREIQERFHEQRVPLTEIYDAANYNFDYMSPEDKLQRKRDAQESIGVFEDVLKLDPTNREAMIRLALSLRDPSIRRSEEARQYYRQIIESQNHDQWSDVARTALLDSFYDAPAARILGMDDQKEVSPLKSRWFSAAANRTTNANVREFYLEQAKIAGSDSALTPEDRLLKGLQTWEESLHGKGNDFPQELGMYQFSTDTGNAEETAKRLAELSPKMKRQFPDLEPYIVAFTARFQVDTNSPVIDEFKANLRKIKNDPRSVLDPTNFFHEMTVVSYCAFDQHLDDVVALILEARESAASKMPGIGYIYQIEDEEKIAKGYAYIGLGRWQEARDIFETFSNRPVHMFHRGPWGDGDNTVIPSKWAAFCLKKLGQNVALNPREFKMDNISIPASMAFATDEAGLWIIAGDELIDLTFDVKTNAIYTLPDRHGVCFCSLCVAPERIWIGTDGDGLIEFNKATHEQHRYTTDNGLWTNYISSLDLDGNRLWIGYGGSQYVDSPTSPKAKGCLGYLDLTAGKFTALTRSAEKDADSFLEYENLPTRRVVTSIAHVGQDDIWLIAKGDLRHYRVKENKWGGFGHGGGAVIVDKRRLFLGYSDTGKKKDNVLGVQIMNLDAQTWRELPADPELAADSVSAMAVDRDSLLVGGIGYVALVDLETDKVRKFSRIQLTPCAVAIGGGYVWARGDCCLYRAQLTQLE